MLAMTLAAECCAEDRGHKLVRHDSCKQFLTDGVLLRRCSFMLSASHLLVDAAGLLLLETRDGGAHRGSGARGQGPAATRHDFVAGLGVALPDATCFTLHVLLAAESAHVPGALLDLVALHDLSEGGTITCAVLARDADLLGTLGHGC